MPAFSKQSVQQVGVEDAGALLTGLTGKEDDGTGAEDEDAGDAPQ